MTIALVVKFRIKKGMESEYERLGVSVARTVEANEPGNLLYRVHRTDDPQVFLALERYKDAAAMEAHRNSPHVKAIMPRLMDLMDGDPEVTIHEEIE